MADNRYLTDSELRRLLDTLTVWEGWADYPGDLAVLHALAARLHVDNLPASVALDAVIAARRAIGRLKPQGGGKPARAGSVPRRV